MNRGPRFGLSWTEASGSVKSADDLPEWGMHVLVNKDADSVEAIDIIAIHGINGHWDNT